MKWVMLERVVLNASSLERSTTWWKGQSQFVRTRIAGHCEVDTLQMDTKSKSYPKRL